MFTRLKKIIMAIICGVLLMGAGVWAADDLESIPPYEVSFEEYTAKQGEDLYVIARKYDLAIEHIMFANDMSNIHTKPGQKLIIPTRRMPPVTGIKNGLVLNLPERGIYLFKEGKVKKFFPVAIGQPGRFKTPTGDLKIINMAKNPTWLPPEWAKEEKPVPPGPDNPLGDRWMGLNRPGFGIHATNNPMSIGLAASHGCVRMYPELAHELYEQVNINMPVKIIYEPIKLSFDPEKKQVFMEVYPDVYKETAGLMKVAKEKLAEYNLLGLVDEKNLEKVIKRKRGIPEPILGTDTVIKVNDKKQSLYFSPISKDGRIWVTSEVLKPVGATVLWNNDDKTVDIYKGKKKVSLKVKQISQSESSSLAGEPVTFLWKGRTIIPLSYVLKNLDVNYYWLPEYRTILIYSGRAKPKTATSKPSEPEYPLPTVVPDDVPPAPEAKAKPSGSPKPIFVEKKTEEKTPSDDEEEDNNEPETPVKPSK